MQVWWWLAHERYERHLQQADREKRLRTQAVEGSFFARDDAAGWQRAFTFPCPRGSRPPSSEGAWRRGAPAAAWGVAEAVTTRGGCGCRGGWRRPGDQARGDSPHLRAVSGSGP